MKWCGILLLQGALSMYASAGKVFTYGYVPTTFPRDPAEINQYSEHMLLGQILEPIIDTDRFGNIRPGLASSWTFEDGGRKIVLNLRDDRVFSNGKPVTAFDAKYTLDRMIQLKSQSGNFIKSISKIEVNDSHKITLHMKDVDVSILKALSRDQLGVVPNEWKFDKESVEPIVGSGAYRLVREGKDWYLLASERYSSASQVGIGKWRLLFFLDSKFTMPAGVIPDYMPGASVMTVGQFKDLTTKDNTQVTEQLSFSQTSAWWRQSGVNYGNQAIKDEVMGLIEDAFSEGVSALGLTRATGVIPQGVAGHIESDPGVGAVEQGARPLTVKVAVVGTLFDDFLKTDILQKAAKQRGINLEILKIVPSELGLLNEKKVDVIFACWAGGFNDPEGFVSLLPTLLGQDLKDYIGPKLAQVYERAKQEQNWTRRSELFREINSSLRASRAMVPGWKDQIFIMSRPELQIGEATYRYTPRLEFVTSRR